MEVKILLVALGVTVVLNGVQFVMHRSDQAENHELRLALSKTSAALAESQAELQLRETVIAQRDADIAELERKAAKQETKYARLVRTKKAVQDWDAAALPDDVLGMLKGSADRAAGASGSTDNGGGNP